MEQNSIKPKLKPTFPHGQERHQCSNAIGLINLHVLFIVGYVVVQIYPWFKSYFLLFLDMVMYDIHSKYFPDSDWLKAHAQFTITSY